MTKTLTHIQSKIYDNCDFQIANFQLEQESAEYEACYFKLNEVKIICRTAKITPKKAGQFVTFWKRKGNGPIEPFSDTDDFDLFVVNVKFGEKTGQFVLPKSILAAKGIISTNKKEGKRAFRVYPPWDVVQSKQAERSQKWQLNYFYEIVPSINLGKVKKLYQL